MDADAPPPWMSVFDTLMELQGATELLSVLSAAMRHGLLDALGDGITAARVAQDLAEPLSRVEALLGVLRAHGVAELAEGEWRLTEPWRDVVRGEAPVSLEAGLAFIRIRGEQLGSALDRAGDYWQLSEQDRLLYARGVSFEPANSAAVGMVRKDIERLPSVLAALEGGGRVLELGCGVASRLTATLRAFPLTTAVGVELAEDLVEFARARAASLGVADRLELVVGDATAYPAEQVFDLVQWSQFFFPVQTRVAALATARRALKPGGWISCPAVYGEPPEPGTAVDKELAAERLGLDLWEIPLRSAHELATELEEAGFVDVVVHPTPVVHMVRGRQP